MDFGIWSLLPPVVAIALAIVTKRVVLSLSVATFLGAAQLAFAQYPFVTAAGQTFVFWLSELQKAVYDVRERDFSHLQVFAFTLLMGGMVGVIRVTRGLEAIVAMLGPFAKGKRGTQLTTWFLGLLIFFDDYANTLLLGNTMRDSFDRVGISRAKLAYLVDSTAAPVAGLALVSTWVATEISFIGEGLAGENLPEGMTAVSLFVESIPYRFYVLYCLFLTFVFAASRRDFGPMLRAEQRATNALRQRDSKTDQTIAKASANNRTTDPEGENQSPDEVPRWRIWLAIIPILAMVVCTFSVIAYSGLTGTAPSTGVTFWMRLGNGDSYVGLVYGSLLGLGLAGLLAVSTRTRWRDVGKGCLAGMKLTLPALLILWLAWTLSELTSGEKLGTGVYLAELIKLEQFSIGLFGWETSWTWSPELRLMLLPTVVFLICAGASFAMGTSWGTMGIVMPIAINVSLALADSAADNLAMLPAVIGSVLAGAIFGDHCSPISDTTVLSSTASGCDHLEHVQTQAPYALVGGGVSVLVGTLPVGWGISPWICLPIGMLLLTASVYLFGRSTENWYEVKA